MQHESITLGDDVCWCVEVIPQNRMPEHTGMNAQLVRSSGPRLEAKHRSHRILRSFVHAPAGLCGLSLYMIDQVPGGVFHILAEWCLDDTVFPENSAIDNGEIGLLRFSVMKLSGKLSMSVSIPCEDYHSRGVAIKSVHDSSIRKYFLCP